MADEVMEVSGKTKISEREVHEVADEEVKEVGSAEEVKEEAAEMREEEVAEMHEKGVCEVSDEMAEQVLGIVKVAMSEKALNAEAEEAGSEWIEQKKEGKVLMAVKVVKGEEERVAAANGCQKKKDFGMSPLMAQI